MIGFRGGRPWGGDVADMRWSVWNRKERGDWASGANIRCGGRKM